MQLCSFPLMQNSKLFILRLGVIDIYLCFSLLPFSKAEYRVRMTTGDLPLLLLLRFVNRYNTDNLCRRNAFSFVTAPSTFLGLFFDKELVKTKRRAVS